MTMENCYRQLGGSYEEVHTRIPNEALIRRFVGAFLTDPSCAELENAMHAGDRAAAFRAAHTLKGVCANLGFERLRLSASALTDALRREAETIPDAALPLWENVQRDYRTTADAISAFLEEA